MAHAIERHVISRLGGGGGGGVTDRGGVVSQVQVQWVR